MKYLYIFCLIVTFACPLYSMESHKPKNAKYPKGETAEKYCYWVYDALNFFGVQQPLNIPVKSRSSADNPALYLLTSWYNTDENAIYINEEFLDTQAEVNQMKACAHEAAHAALARAAFLGEKILQVSTFITCYIVASLCHRFLMNAIDSGTGAFIHNNLDGATIIAGVLGGLGSVMATKKYQNGYLLRWEEYQADKKAAEYLVHKGRAVEYLQFWEPRLNDKVKDKKIMFLGDVTDGFHPSKREICSFIREALEKSQKNEKTS